MKHDHASLFDFKIDLDHFEAVINDPKARNAFNDRYGGRFLDLAARFEGEMNGGRQFDPMPPLDGVRAMQLTFHDNGVPEPPSNRSKLLRPTKTEHSIGIKLWDRPGNINFGDERQVRWKANAYLWTADHAMACVESLLPKKLLTSKTIILLDKVITAMTANGETDLLYSVPMFRKPKFALKWFEETIVVCKVKDKQPVYAWVVHPNGKLVETSSFTDLQAGGQTFASLREKIVEKRGKDKDPNFTHQARLDLCGDFTDWATEVL